MGSQMKFIISENGVTKQTLSKRLEGNLVKSLEEFRIAANEILTKMIKESGDSNDIKMDDIEEDLGSSDDEADVVQLPKKKRK